jgi:hypothetical protein
MMSIEYDEKGKFFTDVVTKIPIPSIVQTTTHLIRGYVHIRQGERLKDELENNERFTAITDVTVSDMAGNVVFSGPFLAVRRDQIIWVMPVDKDSNKGAQG